MARTRRAGFTEHDAVVNGSKLHYAQGPAGAAADPRTDRRLAEPRARAAGTGAGLHGVRGHGQSARAPEKYTAAAIGADLARFVEEIIGKRADSGHNVHGEKPARLAELVRAVTARL
ncbi:hypothetical protein ACFORO_04980 [Amycolatopsis halotolerans]|uniref:Uncharacterized protein n=1 Tax=Amycolatopsis halotolerans TaxID=330083 RepID=A0ABV7QB16_9PSEU